MKKILILTLMFLGVMKIQAQEIKSTESEGNLESPKPCGCIDLSEVTNEHNPADILNGMGKCIELKEFDKAARLFVISGVYGKYDTYRVKDKTAHQALKVLQQNALLNVAEEDKDSLVSSLTKTFEEGSAELNNLCDDIRQVGLPKYYPKYMIQHGIQSFKELEGNGLVEEFDSEESWELALKSYLHCGE